MSTVEVVSCCRCPPLGSEVNPESKCQQVVVLGVSKKSGVRSGEKAGVRVPLRFRGSKRP